MKRVLVSLMNESRNGGGHMRLGAALIAQEQEEALKFIERRSLHPPLTPA